MAVFSAVATGLGAWFAGLGAVGSIVVRIGAGLLLNALSAKLAGKPPKQKRTGIVGEIQQGSDIPRSICVGYTATAGSLAYHNEWGSNNDFYTRITALSDYPIHDLVSVWINEKEYQLDRANPHPDYGWPIIGWNETREVRRQRRVPSDGGRADYRYETYTETVVEQYGWIKFNDGRQTVADTFVRNSVATNERPWDANAIGVGVAHAIATFRFNTQLTRGFPEIIYTLRGARLEKLTGGPAVYTESPGDIVYNLCRGIYYQGDYFYGAQTAGRFDAADFAGEIAKEGEDVPGASGLLGQALQDAFDSDSVPERYRCGMEIDTSRNISEVIADILSASNGRLYYNGTRYRYQVGDPAPAVASFTDAVILSNAQQTYNQFLPLAETVNAVTAVYPDPKQGWKNQEAPPLYDPALQVRDRGRFLPTNIDMPAVPFREQVQRLMNAALKEARRARRLTLTLPAEYFGLEPGDFVAFDSLRNSFVDKLFRVDVVTLTGASDLEIDVTEVDPTDYAWDAASDFRGLNFGAVTPQTPSELVLQGFNVRPAIVYDNVNTPRRPGIAIEWTDPNDARAQGLTWMVRDADTGLTIGTGVTVDLEAEALVLPIAVLPGQQYTVSAKLRYRSRRTLWTPDLVVTTPTVLLLGTDIGADAIERENVVFGLLDNVESVVQLPENTFNGGNIIFERNLGSGLGQVNWHFSAQFQLRDFGTYNWSFNGDTGTSRIQSIIQLRTWRSGGGLLAALANALPLQRSEPSEVNFAFGTVERSWQETGDNVRVRAIMELDYGYPGQAYVTSQALQANIRELKFEARASLK